MGIGLAAIAGQLLTRRPSFTTWPVARGPCAASPTNASASVAISAVTLEY